MDGRLVHGARTRTASVAFRVRESLEADAACVRQNAASGKRQLGPTLPSCEAARTLCPSQAYDPEPRPKKLLGCRKPWRGVLRCATNANSARIPAAMPLATSCASLRSRTAAPANRPSSGSGSPPRRRGDEWEWGGAAGLSDTRCEVPRRLRVGAAKAKTRGCFRTEKKHCVKHCSAFESPSRVFALSTTFQRAVLSRADAPPPLGAVLPAPLATAGSSCARRPSERELRRSCASYARPSRKLSRLVVFSPGWLPSQRASARSLPGASLAHFPGLHAEGALTRGVAARGA